MKYCFFIIGIITLIMGCSEETSKKIEDDSSNQIAEEQKQTTPVVFDGFTLLTEFNYSIPKRRKRAEPKTLKVVGDTVFIYGRRDSWKYGIDSVVENNSINYLANVTGGAAYSMPDIKWRIMISEHGYYIHRINIPEAISWNIIPEFVKEFELNFRNQGIIF